MSPDYTPPKQPALSMKDFRRLGDFIQEQLGIKMPDIKRGMVESRLRKRLTLLKLASYEEYCTYLFSSRGMETEQIEFINAVTTNKTDFFRESRQFTFLSNRLLPHLVQNMGRGQNRRITVWSAACSRAMSPIPWPWCCRNLGGSTPT